MGWTQLKLSLGNETAIKMIDSQNSFGRSVVIQERKLRLTCQIMCGIFGIYSNGFAISERALLGKLVDGLKRLEYRGYDSAGVCVHINDEGKQHPEPVVVRTVGKVQALDLALKEMLQTGQVGLKASTQEGKYQHSAVLRRRKMPDSAFSARS